MRQQSSNNQMFRELTVVRCYVRVIT